MARRVSEKPVAMCGMCYWWKAKYAGTSCRAEGVRARDEPCANFEHIDVADWPVHLSFSKESVRAARKINYPVHLEREVAKGLADLRRTALPTKLRNDSDARVAQGAVATAAAIHSRMPEVIRQVQSARHEVSRIRFELATHLSMLKPIAELKTRTDKDVVIGRACMPIDTKLTQLDQLLSDAKRAMSASAELVKNAEVLTRLTYAVREKV